MARRSYGSRQLSQPKARAALSQLLAGCKPERLAEFTAEGLSSSWNVPITEAKTMLAAARVGRGL